MSIYTYTYPDRKEWLADRPNFVGASEIAAVIGAPGAYLSRWELWARKRGLLSDTSESERMRWGQRLERAIAKGVEEDHGGVVFDEPNGLAAYGPKAKPWQRATPDFYWSREVGQDNWLLEIKNVDRMLAEHWEAGPPPHVVCQVQWQMHCCGYQRAAVAALIGGNRLVLHEVERDQELIDELDRACDLFWDAVRSGAEPSAEARDVNLLPLRWQERRGEVRDLLLSDLEAIVDAQTEVKAAEKRFAECKVSLMQVMGEATEGQVDGKTVVTWRENKAGSRVFRLTKEAEAVMGVMS